MALPLYATTLFVSAFILFLVQPMVAKMILPKLGGTPQVWNTCMVFFQMVLLAGYAYTHFTSSRLRPRQQLMLHGVMLLLPLLVLSPLMPSIGLHNLFTLWTDWTPDNLGGNPVAQTLGVLAMVIGLPFLVVSTTAPLLQKWFVYTGHPAAKDPYFLYGASNFGSMLSLPFYLFIIEPRLAVLNQAWVWAGAYAALIVLVFLCIGFVWGSSPRTHEEPAESAGHLETAAPAPAVEASTAVAAGAPAAARGTGVRKGRPGPGGHAGRADAPAETGPVYRSTEEITPWRRLRWVLLAAVPSSLMLGITTHITTDLSPIPLFWAIPLELYLLSFILVFARWPIVWVEEPHKVMLYAQPVAIALMVMMDILAIGHSYVWMSIFFHVLGFFLTTMVCHGELAKDRPSTKYLTEFYLWMSVGGMVGGMFNALFAPLVFTSLLELSIAIFAACAIRPRMREAGWLDEMVASVLEPTPEAPAATAKGPRGARAAHAARAPAATATPSMSYTLDVIVGLAVLLLAIGLAFTIIPRPNDPSYRQMMVAAFGIPLLIACVLYARPLRFALAIGGIMLAHSLYEGRGDSTEFADRSFFGIISVKQSIDDRVKVEGEKIDPVSFRQLIHGHINHGMNFVKPKDQKEWGNPRKDVSRLATTYYHRLGPAGRVMEKYNWFPNTPENQYWADARMPASLLGQLMGNPGAGAMPLNAFVDLWSEPPFATVGLGTGTMASYGRPFQHVHYYEIDNQIRRLSLPEPGDVTYFTYLQEAQKRGCDVQVLMGDARLRMNLPYINHYAKEGGEDVGKQKGGGPETFYHMMVVDAFSSDAIPAHLITKQAIEMYFEHLTEEGILCIHTSNRFVDLPKVVAAVSQVAKVKVLKRDENGNYLKDENGHNIVEEQEGVACIRGHDNAPFNKTGHFTSEWVMVARRSEYLSRIKDLVPEGYEDAQRANARGGAEPYWTLLTPNSRFLWTDDYYNLMSVVR